MQSVESNEAIDTKDMKLSDDPLDANTTEGAPPTDEGSPPKFPFKFKGKSANYAKGYQANNPSQVKTSGQNKDGSTPKRTGGDSRNPQQNRDSKSGGDKK